MSKKDEALKLALEALEETRNALAWFYDSYPQDVTKKGNKLLPHVETVLTTLREKLAEQPAQTGWEAVAADQAMTIALLKAEQPPCKYPHCPYPCPDLPDCNEVKQSVYLLIVQTPLGLRWKEPEVKNVYANKKKAKEEAARLQKSPQFRGHAWVISKKVK